MLMQCKLLLRVDLNCQTSEVYPKPRTVVTKCSTLDIYGSPAYPSRLHLDPLDSDPHTHFV